MKVYTVQRSYHIPFDDDTVTLKIGCFAKREDALKCATDTFAVMEQAYADDIAHYKGKPLTVGGYDSVIDHEHGYYWFEYGSDEEARQHTVWVDEWDVMM